MERAQDCGKGRFSVGPVSGTSPLGGSESHAAGSHAKDGESRGVLRVEAEGVWPELRFHPMELDGI